MKLSNIFVLFFIMVVSGCSTMPVELSDSKKIPDERIYEAYIKYSAPSGSGSRVIIVRDSGVLGSAASVSLFLNGEIIARLRTAESIVLHVELGDNLFGVAPGLKLWEPDNEGLIEQALQVLPNKTYYYRISIDQYKGNRSHPIAPSRYFLAPEVKLALLCLADVV